MAFVMTGLVVNAQMTHSPVKVSDLPNAITNNLAKDYAGFTVKEATKVTENNLTTFDVVIAKGSTMETLVYDKDGKFVRKMTQKSGTTQNKNVSHLTKPAPKKK